MQQPHQNMVYNCVHCCDLMVIVSCKLMMQELQDLKQEKQQLQEKCEQQEQALQEMGLHLSQLDRKSVV